MSKIFTFNHIAYRYRSYGKHPEMTRRDIRNIRDEIDILLSKLTNDLYISLPITLNVKNHIKLHLSDDVILITDSVKWGRLGER